MERETFQQLKAVLMPIVDEQTISELDHLEYAKWESSPFNTSDEAFVKQLGMILGGYVGGQLASHLASRFATEEDDG